MPYKIKLTADWDAGSGDIKKAGWVVEVDDQTGLQLISEGHIEMPFGTPARKNPEMYGDNGCLPIAQAPENAMVKLNKEKR